MRHLFIGLTFILLLTGCGKEKTVETATASTTPSQKQEQTTSAPFYENEAKGIIISAVENWQLTEEKKTNVVFENDKLKAIITILKSEKDLDAIKQEFKVGAGDITVLEETETTLSFKSNRKESIRTDIFISKVGGQTQIVTFMGQVANYEINQPKITEFHNSIQFN